jgi:hypothetical protein
VRDSRGIFVKLVNFFFSFKYYMSIYMFLLISHYKTFIVEYM